MKTFTLLEDSISVFQYEYGYQQLTASEKNDLLNNISQKILKEIEKRNFSHIIISHFNKNSIKRMFGLLVKQIVGKVGVLVIQKQH